MQATVYEYDPETGTGRVVGDDGVVLGFDAAAMATGGLRHLRPGQRLTVEVEDRRVVRLSLGTIRPS
jgi:2-phospho-L-lactate guanylyltransferase